MGVKGKPSGLKRSAILSGVGLVVVLIGFWIWNSFHQWIPAGHVGVIYHARGGLEQKVHTPKRIFVPWMATLYTYPTVLRSAVYTNDPGEGEVRAADAVQVTTNDNAQTAFDIVVWYHIAPENVLKLFENYRTLPIEQIQAQHIRAAVRQAASVVGTQYDAFGLMGPQRGKASAALQEELKKILEPKGITINRAEFAGAYPNENITARITARVNAETNLNIAKINQEIAQEKKTIAVTRAKAEAEAARLAANQTKGRSLEVLSLDADISALEKWDGQIPPIQVRPGQPVIITPDVLSALRGGNGQ